MNHFLMFLFCLFLGQQICNYQGAARVVVQLVTNTVKPHLHAHSLVGKQCDKGICIADLQPKDSSIRSEFVLQHPVIQNAFFSEQQLLVHATMTVRLLINVHLQMFYSFPNLGILHVTKKNVSKVLEERMIEAYRMGYNYGISIHPEIDVLQGEVRVPRELTGRRSVFMCVCNFPDRLCLCLGYLSIFLLAKSGW